MSGLERSNLGHPGAGRLKAAPVCMQAIKSDCRHAGGLSNGSCLFLSRLYMGASTGVCHQVVLFMRRAPCLIQRLFRQPFQVVPFGRPVPWQVYAEDADCGWKVPLAERKVSTRDTNSSTSWNGVRCPQPWKVTSTAPGTPAIIGPYTS